jgi:peptidoglycan/xylan/chitin deacetylase (PgdA/CDA1 family)
MLAAAGVLRPAEALGAGARRVTDVAGSPYAPGDPVVGLTFDDGPDPVTTPQILDILAAHGARATFFVLGVQAARYPDLVRRIAREGHVVAGHSWNHPQLTGLSEAAFRNEVDGTNRLIESLTGQPVRCVRPPYGASDRTVVARLGARGLTAMLWSVDPFDWRRPGVGAIVNRVLGGVQPGAVVVLHDRRSAQQTPVALPAILDGLARRGLRSVTICGQGVSPSAHQEVVSFGAAPAVALDTVTAGSPLVSAAGAAPARGVRLASNNGGVFAYGGNSFLGSLAGTTLRAPVVATAATPTGDGYWLAAADGGVFAFGDAPYLGRAPEGLNQPVVGMTATPTGRGYWLAAADGGVFAFGDAAYFGSVSVDVGLQRVTGMAATPSGRGYWLVEDHGRVFPFGDARFLAAADALPLQAEMIGIAATPTGQGYWLLGSDGGVFAFGDAPFLGSAVGVAKRTAIAITGTPTGDGYWVLTERPG